jgi:hypothetical protein
MRRVSVWHGGVPRNAKPTGSSEFVGSDPKEEFQDQRSFLLTFISTTTIIIYIYNKTSLLFQFYSIDSELVLFLLSCV